MIVIEPSSPAEISKDALTPFAGTDYAHGFAVGRVSLLVWAVRDGEATLAFVGTSRTTLLSQTEGFVLLCEGFERRALSLLKVLRRVVTLFRTARGPFDAWVDPKYRHFAEFLGFSHERTIAGWCHMRAR